MFSVSAFPLIRHISRPVTEVLARLPVSTNQVTAVSLGFGLGAAWAASLGSWVGGVAASALMIGAYVLDNCDGEIARLKNQCSRFGMYFDSFVDWIVHTVFFWGLGVGTAAAMGEQLWNWLGLVAAAGGTINYVLGFVLEGGQSPPASLHRPETAADWAVLIFRELTRADFCFIVLALALFDVLWLLLPAGAVGAHVYWVTALFKRAREFHV
jgi:phosphatidylglycerophosphate synthase